MRKSMEFLLFWTLLNILTFCEGRKNVLFLVADDMRAELNAYRGPDFPSSVHPKMFTPNIDALAAKSLLLKRAYVQQALCSPSRSSFLTGRRPDTTHVYNLETFFREVGGNFTTIPQYFKMKGYESIGMGKIYHGRIGNDDPISWTKPYTHGKRTWEVGQNSWRAVPDHMLMKTPLQDKQIADLAVSTLKQLAPKAKTGEKPFFLAVGFKKPHLPFIFPQSFLSHYPMSAIHLPNNQFAPKDMPIEAWSTYNELRSGYPDISALHATGNINTTLPSNTVLSLRRAYYSAISYIDSLVGQILSELAHLGLDQNTVVSFIGDHGWQLGEHGEWCKHTNFELAAHAPMMVRVPGKTDNGIVTEKLVEFVDLFPTLVDAAGLGQLQICPENSANIETCTEGTSLMQMINNPNGAWKHAAFSQFPRHKHGSDIMGYTMRTNRYRYTEWVKFHGKPVYKPDWNTVYAVELYDHQTDPDENVNKGNNPYNLHLRTNLRQQLRAGWRHAIKTTGVNSGFGR